MNRWRRSFYEDKGQKGVSEAREIVVISVEARKDNSPVSVSGCGAGFHLSRRF